MKLNLYNVLEDWRNSVCIVCERECHPSYRFCYDSDKKDIHGNSVIDTEVEVCRHCCNKIDKNWKSKCDQTPSKISEITMPMKK